MAISHKTLFFITIICAISYRVLTEVQKEENKIKNEEVIPERTNGTTNTTCSKIHKFEATTIMCEYTISLIFVVIINVFLWKQQSVPENWRPSFMANLQSSIMAVNLTAQILAFMCEFFDAKVIIEKDYYKPTLGFISRIEFCAGSLLISHIFYDTISKKQIDEEAGRLAKWIDENVRLLLSEGFWWLCAAVILSTYPEYIGYTFIITNFFIMIMGAYYENDCQTIKTIAMFLFRCRMSILAALKIWYNDEFQKNCLMDLGYVASFLKLAEITRGIVVYFIWLQDTNTAQKEAIKTLTNYILARPNGRVDI